jgi:hypothetical protein
MSQLRQLVNGQIIGEIFHAREAHHEEARSCPHDSSPRLYAIDFGTSNSLPRLARAIEQRFGAGKVRQLRSFHSVVQGLAERARKIACLAR